MQRSLEWRDTMAIADRSSTSTESDHDRRLARRLEDPEFRREFEREAAETRAIDTIVNALDALRAEHGMTKSDLAREIGKNPSSVRRLLTLDGSNPELRTVVAMANALDADVCLVPRGRRRRARRTAETA
jgi:DNA-binding phage protein